MSWGLFLTRNGTWNMFCWIHLLLVKGSLCSKQKGTDRKISSADMLCVEASFLHGTEREMYSTEHMFCWIHWGNIGEICSIDTRGKYLFITRNGTRNLFDMLLERNGSGNLFFRIFFLVHRYAPLRVTIEMGIALEHMNIAYDWVRVSYLPLIWTVAKGLFITRRGSGNLLNRYAISQGLFIF